MGDDEERARDGARGDAAFGARDVGHRLERLPGAAGTDGKPGSTQANTARSLANRANTAGDQERTQDLLNFNRWLEVSTEGNQQLADLYQRRLRPEFLPAFEAWLASDPENNPDAESSPLREPEYRVADLEKSDRLEAQGTEHFDNGKEATENTDSYVLTTVFFATVLFFAGISLRFAWQSMRIVVLVIGSLSLVYAIVLVARLPIL